MNARLASLVLLVAPLLQSSGALFAQTPPAAVALVGGRLIDGTGRPPIENAVVVMQGERIVAAGPQNRVAAPRNATIVRDDGKTVMPGIIESNGHIIFSGQTGHPLYWARRWEQYYEIGARNLFTNLMQGVTTIRDTMDPLDVMLQLR